MSDATQQGRLLAPTDLHLHQPFVDDVVAIATEPHVRQREVQIVLWPPSLQSLGVGGGGIGAVFETRDAEVLAELLVFFGALWLDLEELEEAGTVDAVQRHFFEEVDVFFGLDIGVEDVVAVGGRERVGGALDGADDGVALTVGWHGGQGMRGGFSSTHFDWL